MGEKFLTRFNAPSDGWGVDLFEGLDGVWGIESMEAQFATPIKEEPHMERVGHNNEKWFIGIGISIPK
jgi:hypothetical protein